MKSVLFWIVLFFLSLEIYSQPDRLGFELLSPDNTGIHFRNDLTDTRDDNFFIYKNFYQGGGVAIGDIDNDGLQDIYFTGNQVGDKLYLNKGNFRFEDITTTAGITNDGNWSTGVTIVDINNDGLKDIYVCKGLYHHQPERRRNQLYINQGNNTFIESAKAFGLDDPWRTQHASFFDYDRDGDFDVFIINQPPNPSKLAPIDPNDGKNPSRIYRMMENTGGRFVEVTEKAGLLNTGFGLSAAVGDFNNDGWQDIYVANDYDGPDFFYQNNKDGTFTNTLPKSFGHISNFSMGSDLGDINNDGWLDLSVVDMVAEDNYRLKANMSGMDPARFWQTVATGGHYQYMFNTLQLNNGHTGDDQLYFSDIAQLTGTANTDWSWSPLLADFDNNGHLDLFVTNGIKREMRNTDALAKMDDYLKSHIGDLSLEGAQAWSKIDLHQMLDFFPSVKLKNYMFSNSGDLQFENVTDRWQMGQATFSTGAAYGDLDNDGDLDLVINNVDDLAFVYENKTTNRHFLRIKTARESIGTRMTVYSGQQRWLTELSSASGISSSSEPVLHVGLGTTSTIDSVRIDWYTGASTMIYDMKPGEHTINREESVLSMYNENSTFSRYFEDVTDDCQIDYLHKENRFDDYKREVLLPHKMSTLGSGVAVADMNGDGLDDFFVGAAAGHQGKVFVQQRSGQFQELPRQSFNPDLNYEDMGAVWFDADGDGDQDLYVVSGGNEYDEGSPWQQDRFYLNAGGNELLQMNEVLPSMGISGGRVKAYDYDSDGDIDLFVAGRQVPGRYPEPSDSYLLKNLWQEEGRLTFEPVAEPQLTKLGMVTDAVWSDYDSDGDADLIVCGMWMAPLVLENHKGEFDKKPLPLPLNNAVGWWSSIVAADLDGDGDDDYILGNLGNNYKYKASEKEPFTVHYDDFDGNGSNDIVLGYYNYGNHYPVRGRSCSSQQIPGIKKEFKNYHQFALASLSDIYGSEPLSEALHYKAGIFSSICIENNRKKGFKVHALPVEAQLSSVNGVIVSDVDGDGKKDLVIAGNLYGAEVETPRNDASAGLLLRGGGDFTFSPAAMHRSGLKLTYDVKELKKIRLVGGEGIVVAVNNGPLRLIKIKKP